MKEIERKFLVDRDEVLRLILEDCYESKKEIQQIYLSEGENLEVRIRKTTHDRDDSFTMTLKSGNGLIRKECQHTIAENTYYALLNDFRQKEVRKIRYLIDMFEVDVYVDHNWPLIVAEIELSSPEQSFTKPSWLREEITGDKQYSNASLAK